jgi:hypothetical protein
VGDGDFAVPDALAGGEEIAETLLSHEVREAGVGEAGASRRRVRQGERDCVTVGIVYS